ncbi:hypothetical protein FXF51_06350 [Nonomuraea sp. PA05]|uniref:hypothetical protein n=1 Tax=Nonomuraea sp. PA05 TaxID=2604466 RepID=UPI0011DC40F9|nr:hypothetical protein [Nonomuraea sp. PA05]TYB69782.1 hypothetical protein FXF51_06350 [Nonomuraea sp. PA05]
MNEEETRAYYDRPENAQAMCSLLMRTHPHWVVWRQRTVGHGPMWFARRETWGERRPSLADVNAGGLNEAMATSRGLW